MVLIAFSRSKKSFDFELVSDSSRGTTPQSSFDYGNRVDPRRPDSRHSNHPSLEHVAENMADDIINHVISHQGASSGSKEEVQEGHVTKTQNGMESQKSTGESQHRPVLALLALGSGSVRPTDIKGVINLEVGVPEQVLAALCLSQNFTSAQIRHHRLGSWSS